MNHQKRYYIRGLIGTILIITGIGLAAFSDFEQPIIMALINAGMIILVINLYLLKKGGGIRHDERSRKIGAYSLSQSWFSTFVILNIIFWLNDSGLIHLTINHFFAILFIVMLSTPHFFRLYYRNKKDL